MPDLLGTGTNRGHSMIGLGIGLGLSEFRLANGTSFNPTKITGLKWWIDATDSATLFQSEGGAAASADGDPIGYVMDKSSSALHLIQPSGTNKPALKKAIKNSKDVIRLDGVNDFLYNVTISGFKFLHSQDSTVFVVFKFNSLAGATSVIYDTCDLNNAAIGSFVYVNSSGAINNSIARTGASYCVSNASATSYIASGSWYVASFKNNPSNATANLRSYGYKNAGSAFNNNSATSALSTADASYAFLFGRNANSSANYPSVDIGEVIMYDSALSDSNRALVDSYLNNKWGVY